jgi:Holliday junction resolvase
MEDEWKKCEQKSANIYGKKAPGSGGGPYEKLDIIGQGDWEGYRIEVKYTEKDSYSLNKKTLTKMEQQALQMNAKGFLIVQLKDRRYVIMEENLFLGLRDDNTNS